MRAYGYRRGVRASIGWDLHAAVLPRVRLLMEGDVRRDERTTCELVFEVSSRGSDALAMIAFDLSDTEIERRLISPVYWTIREAMTAVASFFRKLLASSPTRTEAQGDRDTETKEPPP